MGDRDRPTSKLHRDELLGLARHSVRAPTSAYPIVDQNNRATEQMDPTHFQLLLRVEREGLPLAPEDIVCMQREEAEAWLEMRTAKGSANDLAPIRDPVLPTAPRRRLWSTAMQWLVGGVVAVMV